MTNIDKDFLKLCCNLKDGKASHNQQKEFWHKLKKIDVYQLDKQIENILPDNNIQDKSLIKDVKKKILIEKKANIKRDNEIKKLKLQLQNKLDKLQLREKKKMEIEYKKKQKCEEKNQIRIKKQQDIENAKMIKMHNKEQNKKSKTHASLQNELKNSDNIEINTPSSTHSDTLLLELEF